MMEDEKLALGLSDQLPSAQSLLQGQAPFPINQVSGGHIGFWLWVFFFNCWFL